MEPYQERNSGRRQGHFPTTDTSNLNPQTDGSYKASQLDRFFQDLFYEPNWREEAEVDAAYYDGDQLSSETLRKMRENGIMPAVLNFVAPAIDAIAGLEIITRSDLRCVAKDDESYQVAQGMNSKFREACQVTRFNNKVGEQYRECVTIGISWLEVSRNRDPFEFSYRVTRPGWREMFIDYRAREADYSDARYMIRRMWFDEDVLLQYFPNAEHQKIIKSASYGLGSAGTNDWITMFDNQSSDIAGALRSDHNSEERWTLDRDEWLNNTRGRAGLIEILYYVPQMVEVLRLKSGHVIQLDRASEFHLELVKSGQAQYAKGSTKQWRQGFYIGRERLADIPLATNMPHYIPMVAYRKNNNGAPYGLMRRMRSPQDNINSRNTRINYDLSSRKYYIDEDAVQDPKQTARELNKQTSFIMLQKDRTTEMGIRESLGTETTPHTFQMLQEAKMNLYDVTGLYPEFRGQIQSAGQSGQAIDQLVEQSAKVLGVVVDNYREAKLKAARQLQSLLVGDMANMDDQEVEVESESGEHSIIVLNAREADGRRTNDLLLARMDIELEPIPSSHSYRQQKFQALTEIVKSMPPEMQGAMMDLVVRAAQLPNSEEMLDRIRTLTGHGPAPKDPEKRAAIEQQQQQKAELEQQVQAIEMAIRQGEAALTEARAVHEQAKAQKLAQADTDHTEAKTLVELAKAEGMDTEQKRKGVETESKLLEASTRLRQEKNREQKSKADSKTSKNNKK